MEVDHFEVHRLTTKGRLIAKRLFSSHDLRLDHVERLPFEEKAAVSVHAHYRMLERAGFDLESVNTRLEQDKQVLGRALSQIQVPSEHTLLFSPFQSLSIMDIADIFPSSEPTEFIKKDDATSSGLVVGRGSREHLFVKPTFTQHLNEVLDSETSDLEKELHKLQCNYPSAEEAAQTYVESRVSDTHVQFYPLVSRLFRLLGFESGNSRFGVKLSAMGWLG